MKNKQSPNRFKKRLRNNIFTRFFRAIGSLIDLLFSKNISLIIISILTASILYVYVIDLPSQWEIRNLETRTLEDVKIEIVNNDKAKVIEVYDQNGNLLDNDDIYADLIVKGPRNEVLKMINNNENTFFIDTTSVKDGEEKDMQVTVDNISENMIVTSSPSSFRVEAHKRVVRTDLLLEVEAVNADKMGNNLTVEKIELPSAGEAQISGSSERVQSVASLKALVNVESINGTGEIQLPDSAITYRAYDTFGETVNVDVNVKVDGATVYVDDYGKEVPIVANFVGELPEGQSIGEYELSINNVYIFGDKEKLSSITQVAVDVNLVDIKSNSSITLNITKPEGVISLSEDSVTVKLNYEKTVSKTISNVPVQAVNLGPGFNVQSTDGDLLLDVELHGAKSVLDQIDVNDILLEVDLKDLSAGKHSVKVTINGLDSRVGFSLSKEKVVVEITK